MTREIHDQPDYDQEIDKTFIVPPPPRVKNGDEERLDGWGFADTEFAVDKRGHVVVTGSRYAICGQEMPRLVPWIGGIMEYPLDPGDLRQPSYPPAVPGPRPMPGFLAEIRELLDEDQLCTEARVHLRHGHGHTQEEIFAVSYGRLERVPDLVVYPTSEKQVAALVQAAARHEVCLIPYGGGTNVTDALRCPDGEARPVVSVDMRRMNRILWIDPVNLTARIEAGAVGRQIVEQLAEHGLTMGHEPDSVEFSTLGGWIATNASGMKKNRYGNIEDLVLDMRVVTSAGMLTRSSVVPRESIGLDARRWVFGSEGTLGIITSAVVKLFPLPEVTRYDSAIFPTFKDGLDFMYELTRAGPVPASVRLMDNVQFHFGQALKPEPGHLGQAKSRLEKLYVTRMRGFDLDRLAAATLVFEGSREEVKQQQRAVARLVARHRGMMAGGENGERGYQLTFSIAYIRDMVFRLQMVAESFETSVPWSRADELCRRVKQRCREEHAARGLPGKPFVTCRVTQVYGSGVCVYFYLGFHAKGLADPTGTYKEIEEAARDEILACGGSLSHHHGVGKLRAPFLPRIMSPAALRWSKAAKQALDPENIFGAANQDLGLPDETAPRVRLREVGDA